MSRNYCNSKLYVAAVPQQGVAGGDNIVPLLDNVNCQGLESNLLGCNHDGINQHSCNGSFDVAGVVCGGKYNECTG